MLALTTPLQRLDVIDQHCIEQQLSRVKRDQLLRMAAGAVPRFVPLSLGIQYVASLTLVTVLPPVMVCDPAFVAETPGSCGVLLKIGHFDDVGGITHVEI